MNISGSVALSDHTRHTGIINDEYVYKNKSWGRNVTQTAIVLTGLEAVVLGPAGIELCVRNNDIHVLVLVALRNDCSSMLVVSTNSYETMRITSSNLSMCIC